MKYAIQILMMFVPFVCCFGQDQSTSLRNYQNKIGNELNIDTLIKYSNNENLIALKNYAKRQGFDRETTIVSKNFPSSERIVLTPKTPGRIYHDFNIYLKNKNISSIAYVTMSKEEYRAILNSLKLNGYILNDSLDDNLTDQFIYYSNNKNYILTQKVNDDKFEALMFGIFDLDNRQKRITYAGYQLNNICGYRIDGIREYTGISINISLPCIWKEMTENKNTINNDQKKLEKHFYFSDAPFELRSTVTIVKLQKNKKSLLDSENIKKLYLKDGYSILTIDTATIDGKLVKEWICERKDSEFERTVEYHLPYENHLLTLHYRFIGNAGIESEVNFEDFKYLFRQIARNTTNIIKNNNQNGVTKFKQKSY